jgi:gliding motility-associated-like protein
MKKFIPGTALLLVLLHFNMQAQGIRRSVISSIGDSGNAGGIYLSCTVAQPPNAGTITSNTAALRQGFQQPVSSTVIDPACAIAPQALFTADDLIDACGQRFSFAYADAPETGTQFSWNFGQDALPPTSTLENPLSVVYSTTGTKIVTLTVTTGNCVFSAAYTINVTNASFGAHADATPATCHNNKTGSITLTTVNGQNPVSYQWSNGQTTSSIDGLAAGPYSFTVTDGSGCTFASVATVGAPDQINIDKTLTVESCTGAKDGAVDVTVSGGTAPYTFLWSNGETQEDISGLAGGLYSLTVTDAAGCAESFDAGVLTVCEGFEFDNLITPNSDGANDVWIVPGIESFPNNELQIFNRWGNVVYQVKPYTNNWAGTNTQGKPLPVGAYFYILKLNNTEKTVYSGSISILK